MQRKSNETLFFSKEIDEKHIQIINSFFLKTEQFLKKNEQEAESSKT